MKLIHLIIIFVICISVKPMTGQSVHVVLKQIEQNNKTLQVAAKSDEATKIGIDAENSLTDPNVTYSSFYSKDVKGQAGSEMVVTQGFDFPTLYTKRKNAGRERKAVIDFHKEVLRRNTLLEAQKLCFDIIQLEKEKEFLTTRQQNADELLLLFEERLKAGDVSIIEVNKIKMERMSIQTALLENNTAIRTTSQSLTAMNGNHPLDFHDMEYPVLLASYDFETMRNEAIQYNAEILAATSNQKANESVLRVMHHNWLPKFEMGYRRNTTGDFKQHGFLVGGSIPIFSNRQQVKIAKANAVSANLLVEETRLKIYNSIETDINEAKYTLNAMAIYDINLMKETLLLLTESVKSGILSITDYYTEVDEIYRNLGAYTKVENRFQKAIASLRKWSL